MIYETFSKRRLKAINGAPDVFVYEVLPAALREQLIHVFDEAFSYESAVWREGAKILAREHGVARLASEHVKLHSDPQARCFAHLRHADWDKALDLVELLVRFLDPNAYSYAERIAEVNERFREHAVGYQFQDGGIVRVDSTHLHSEVVVPALKLLSAPEFSGPDEEFRGAYKAFCSGRNASAILEAGKAIESTLKAICTARGWGVPKQATATNLFKTIKEKELVPARTWAQYEALLSTLKSGAFPLRNSPSVGHGQGASVQPDPPAHVVAYALHMTAAAVVFLVESHIGTK
ncbi:MAG: hypothetical protein AAF721_23735 [Myxococcota bacterium]